MLNMPPELDRGNTLSVPPALRLARYLAIGLLVVSLGLGFWHGRAFLAHTLPAVAFLYPLDGLEGTLLFEARLLRDGEPLYQPLRPDRFISAPYQPLSYLALAAAEHLAYGGGPPPADVTVGPVFRPGRIVSLLAISCAGLLAGLAAWRLSGSPLAGLLLPGLWLGFAPAQLWAARIKPDPLALLLTAAGLLCVAMMPPAGAGGVVRRRLGPAAAGFFALAFFTKQTALAAPLATGLMLALSGTVQLARGYGWLAGQPDKPANKTPPWFALGPPLRFAGSYLGLLGLGWLGLQWLSGGQYGAHVFGLHSPDWWAAGLFRKYLNLLLESTWPLLIGLALLLIDGIIRLARPTPGRPAGNRPPFALIYAMCALPGLLAAGAEGAHHNHLLEPYLALCLAVCSRINLQRFSNPYYVMSNFLASLLILLQLLLLTQRPAWYGGEFNLARQERSQFIALIKSQPGEVLADDVALLLAAGRPLRYDDPSTMGPAARSGLWDESNLLREVAERRFSLILLPFDANETELDPSGRWSPAFIAMLKQHYRLLYRDVIFSYVPRE